METKELSGHDEIFFYPPATGGALTNQRDEPFLDDRRVLVGWLSPNGHLSVAEIVLVRRRIFVYGLCVVAVQIPCSPTALSARFRSSSAMSLMSLARLFPSWSQR
jgi:hypothetical protein